MTQEQGIPDGHPAYGYQAYAEIGPGAADPGAGVFPGPAASMPRERTRVVGRRVAQNALDRLATVGPAIAVLAGSLLLMLTALRHGAPPAVVYAPPLLFLLTVFVGGLLNEVWLPRRWHGATLGMRLLRLRVVDAAGEPPRTRAYAVRWVLWVVDGLFFGLAGLAVMLLTPHRQRLGDILARTYVVRDERVRGRERDGGGRDSGATAGAGAGDGANGADGAVRPPGSSDSGGSVHEPVLPGPDGSLGTVAEAELALDRRQMRLDGGH